MIFNKVTTFIYDITIIKMLKFIRWLLFILATSVVLYLIELAFSWIIDKMLLLSSFWLAMIAFSSSMLIVGLFSLFCSLLIMSLILISPNKKIGGTIFGILALMSGAGNFAYCIMLDIKILPKIIILYTITFMWIVIASAGLRISKNNFDS